MSKLQVVNNENEVVREIALTEGGSFGVTYYGYSGPLHDVENLLYIRFDDKHVLSQTYQATAMALIGKYSRYLTGVRTDQLAFIVDEAWEPSEKANKNSAWKIDIAKAPYWLRMFTGCDYMVKMRMHWLDEWSNAQLHAAIMSQLLRINPEDGNVIKYNEDFQSKFVATFGIGYLEPHTVIPDLLQEQVRIVGFKEASGQITIDELPVQSADSGTGDGDVCDECVNWCEGSAGMGSCNAEMEPGAIADSHPACEEFYPAYSMAEIPSGQDDLYSDDEPDDDLADIGDDDEREDEQDNGQEDGGQEGGGDHGDAA